MSNRKFAFITLTRDRNQKSGHFEKLTRDNCWGALKWHGQEYPDYKQGTLRETKWVWGFVDEALGVGKKNEKGKEIRTAEEPENEKLRWLTENRDKHRVFNY